MLSVDTHLENCFCENMGSGMELPDDFAKKNIYHSHGKKKSVVGLRTGSED